MFSKPKLISIGLLLAILLFSLIFSSNVEGLENASISEKDAIDIVNKDAPKSKLSELEMQPQLQASGVQASGVQASGVQASGVQASGVQASDQKASDQKASGVQASGVQASGQKALEFDGIVLGKNKPLSVANITNTLQNNPGVQKLISNKGL
jgi:hypothetical protein